MAKRLLSFLGSYQHSLPSPDFEYASRNSRQAIPLVNDMESIQSPLALRPRQAAKALSISPRLLWQLTKDGHIPCVRVGNGKRRSVLYPLADLQAWLTRQTVSANGGDREPR